MYDRNTDQTFTVHFPKAARIVIEFDPQTRTETNYDFMRFFKVGTHIGFGVIVISLTTYLTI